MIFLALLSYQMYIAKNVNGVVPLAIRNAYNPTILHISRASDSSHTIFDCTIAQPLIAILALIKASLNPTVVLRSRKRSQSRSYVQDDNDDFLNNGHAELDKWVAMSGRENAGIT